ncbi:trichohyalin-like isoform X2 [Macrosteles quadrilineatus]|uniref:trichohyalin-like isoform X2 n=1 Tax=Macrosteles quadrilineatus TaxID=74068 RepID=UPI0023E1D07D|nr:trichohyalin-like isoform X2 [Macrosteles quadrilineatus]
MSRPADRQPSTASRLKGKEVAALQRALESERSATRAAQERCRELQQTLDSERSAGRAWRREVATQVRVARQQEADKYAALLDNFKTRMELAQTEAIAAEKESIKRSLTAEFQREFHARQEELRREAKQQVELLQEQLRESRRVESPPRSEVEALVHSLHAEFHRNLNQKQDEWKREHQAQVESLTTQLREMQRLYTDTCNKLTTTTNEAENIPKLRQEIQTLKHYNKDLEEKIQMLTEADRRKVEDFRSQHEENSARIAELQKSARKETFQLLEEMKSKDRVIDQLQRQYHILATRLDKSLSPHGSLTRSRMISETSLKEPERPGEHSRLCIKRPKQLSFASDVNKRLRAQEGRKPPDPPGPDVVTTKREDDQPNNEQSNSNSWEPSNEKEKSETESSQIINMWTKKVGLETLYQLLLEEHQELQRSHVVAITRLRDEERQRTKLEQQLRECRRAEGDNLINLALAEQITELQQRQAELEAEAQELREQNDLLEFRILELDDGVSCSSFHYKSPSSRSPDTRDREIDDVSDSGVMSLPTSEDISEADFQDFKMEPNNRDVKCKLAQLCQSLENVSERISIQQALALLRHYETRLESLEATLAAMCQEAAQTKGFETQPSLMDHAKSPSRIIATVLPFNDLSSTYHCKDVKDEMPIKRLLRDQDCMQESGIFEDNGLTACLLNVATQTDWTFDPPPGDLGAEIRKLTRIRERIEEKGGNKKLLKTSDDDPEFLTHTTSLKELLFYRERVQMLEEKIAIYESHGDEQSRLLALRLEKEVLLAAQIKHLQSTLRKLKEQNRLLEEEKCEFEEAENDTRLRCQKLEVKLSALGEKKSDLQVQLQQNARTMSNLRSSLSEEERKRNEARQYAAKMEALVNKLEQQNFEMEEKEIEVRYRLHTLENIIPAMVMYYLWRMLNSARPYIYSENRKLVSRGSVSDTLLIKPINSEQENKTLFTSPGLQSCHDSENLRKSLEEIKRFLTLKEKGEVINPNVPGTSSAAILVIEELSNKCQVMDERIKELEFNEKAYQETVQAGDEMLMKMEQEYKQQLKSLEEELSQKQADIIKAEAQIRRLSRNNDLETQFQEQVNQLENEISRLTEKLAQKDKEKKTLQEKHDRLFSEREDAIDKLNNFIENIEKPLREELDIVKRKIRDLLGDLDLREQEKVEIDEINRSLGKELNQRGRELDESEVTISELREEVQTLEREVLELRAALSQERDNNDQLMIAVERERQLRDVPSPGSDAPSLAGSLHEELLDAAEHHVDVMSTRDVAASNTPPSPSTSRLNDCYKSEQIIKEFDPNNPIPVKFLDRTISAYQHSRNCWNCTNTYAPQLRHILSILQKTAPQSKMNHTSPGLLDDNLEQTPANQSRPGTNQSSPSLTVINNNTGEDLSSIVSGLVAKCRVKDHMIRCLADQLRPCPWLFNDLLKNLSLDPVLTYDFTRISLYEYINGTLKPSITEISEGDDPGYSSTNPLLLSVVDKPDPFSLLVTWTLPTSNNVTGFKIVVVDQVCERIYTPARTSAVLQSLDLRKPVTITIFALQQNGAVVQEHSVHYPPRTT